MPNPRIEPLKKVLAMDSERRCRLVRAGESLYGRWELRRSRQIAYASA